MPRTLSVVTHCHATAGCIAAAPGVSTTLTEELLRRKDAGIAMRVVTNISMPSPNWQQLRWLRDLCPQRVLQEIVEVQDVIHRYYREASAKLAIASTAAAAPGCPINYATNASGTAVDQPGRRRRRSRWLAWPHSAGASRGTDGFGGTGLGDSTATDYPTAAIRDGGARRQWRTTGPSRSTTSRMSFSGSGAAFFSAFKHCGRPWTGELGTQSAGWRRVRSNGRRAALPTCSCNNTARRALLQTWLVIGPETRRTR